MQAEEGRDHVAVQPEEGEGVAREELIGVPVGGDHGRAGSSAGWSGKITVSHQSRERDRPALCRSGKILESCR